MAATSMIQQTIYLDPQPGSIPPVVHLKQGTTSGNLILFINAGKGYDANSRHFCILKGTRSDGSELYLTGSTTIMSSMNRFLVGRSNLSKMTEVSGKYLAELTVFDTASSVSRRNVSNYDTITTAKFYVDVEENAYQGEET